MFAPFVMEIHPVVETDPGEKKNLSASFMNVMNQSGAPTLKSLDLI